MTLSPAAQLLYSQQIIPQGTRNDSLTRIAGLLRYWGSSEGEIVQELRGVNRQRCRPCLADREVQKIATSIAKKPAGSGRESVAVLQARRTVQVWQAEVPVHAWWGLAGATRRKVWLALLELAAAAGTLTIGVSLRSLAERAGVRLSTALKIMDVLQAQGWLVRESKGRGREASKYLLVQPPAPLEPTGGLPEETEQEDLLQNLRFVAPTALSPASSLTSPTPTPGGVVLMYQSCPIGSDTWRWSGLGSSAYMVYTALMDRDWPSAAALAKARNMNKRTVARALQRLESIKLAAKTDTVWTRGIAEVETVAQSLRSAGAGERQRHLHAHECALYLDHYEDHHTRSHKPGVQQSEPPDPVWEKELRAPGDTLRLAASFKRR